MNDEIKRLNKALRQVRETALPELQTSVADLDQRLEALGTRMAALEESIAHVPKPEELKPVPATDFLRSLSDAVSTAQAQLAAEAPTRPSYAIGTVRAEVAAHLIVDKDGGVEVHLPRPDVTLQEGTLTRLRFSIVPVGRPEGEPTEQEVLVPTVVGQPLELAERQLAAAGLSTGEVSYADHRGAEGIVLSQDPSGDATLLSGEAVALTVSRRTHVFVPDLVGVAESDAIEMLGVTDLRRRIVRKVFPGVEPGTVVAQEPVGGTEVERRTQVRVTVAAAEKPPTPTARRPRPRRRRPGG